MKKILILMLLIFVCVLNFGCGMITGKGEAQEVAEALLNERLENGGFGSDEYYSKIFWNNTDVKKWESIKKLVFKAVGDLRGYSLSTWNIQSKAHTNQLSGTFVVLVYETEYEKGNGTEKLTMHKGLTDDEFTIMGHHFNSPEIQALINKGIEQIAAE